MNIYTQKKDYTEVEVISKKNYAKFFFDKSIANKMKDMGNWLFSKSCPHNLRFKNKSQDFYLKAYFNLSKPIILHEDNKIIYDYRSSSMSNSCGKEEDKFKDKISNLSEKSTIYLTVVPKDCLKKLCEQFNSTDGGNVIFISQKIRDKSIYTEVFDLSKTISLDKIFIKE